MTAFRIGIVIALAVFPSLTWGQKSALESAGILFQRLTGTKLNFFIPEDQAKLVAMANHLQTGDLTAAAQIATQDPSFSDSFKKFTRHFGSSSTNDTEELNRLSAILVAVANDNEDARKILYEDFRAVFNEAAYMADGNPDPGLIDETEKNHQNPNNPNNTYFGRVDERLPASYLTLAYPQRADNPDEFAPAGVLSIYDSIRMFIEDGTNRRIVPYVLKEFLCRPLELNMDSSVPDDLVRRDVNRIPANDATLYLTKCKGCHAPMDALAGAFVKWEFLGNGGVDYHYYAKPSGVWPKTYKNGDVYSEGHVPGDTYWENRFSFINSTEASAGYGTESAGRFLAASEEFASCMVQKSFKYVCNKDLNLFSQKELHDEIKKHFQDSGYVMRRLFEKVATTEACNGVES